MTADGSLARFSSRNSTNTAATSMISMDEELFLGSGGGGGGEKSSSSRSRSMSRKLVKPRSKSPSAFGSDSEGASPMRPSSRSNPGSRATSVERGLEYSDVDDSRPMRTAQDMDESDMDLSLRLELARRNSQSQHGISPAPLPEPNVEETIYEGALLFVSVPWYLSHQ